MRTYITRDTHLSWCRWHVQEVRRDDPRHPRGLQRKPLSCLAVLSLPARNVRSHLRSLITITNTHVRYRALKARPNAAHAAIASFSLPWIRHAVAPDSTFTLITQNVDGLSARALESVEASATASEGYSATEEQPKLLEMHGRIFDVLCSSDSCGHVEYDTTSPICEGLAGTEVMVSEGTLDPEIPVESLPRCSKCGSLTRPGLVWFGEMPQYLDTIDQLVKRADLCIVVGTSSTARKDRGIRGILLIYLF